MPENFFKLVTLGMGNSRSKQNGRGKKSKESSSYIADKSDPRVSIETMREHEFWLGIQKRFAEDIELEIMRRTMETDPETFILNNLVMSIQFFENYDEEISDIRKTLASSRESELNARLPPQKHTLIPDVLHQHVAQKIDFTYMLPTLKQTIELLQPIRIYVVFDNIEVTEESYASPYCSVNETTTYSMQLKPSSSHKGYVQLQRLEVNPPKKTASADDLRLSPVTSSTREDIYSDGDSLYDGKSIRSDGSGVFRRMKNVRDVNDDESIYGDGRYASRGDVLEFSRKNNVKEENVRGDSTEGSLDGLQSRNGRNTTRKGFETRRGPTKNIGRQYEKTKLRSANGSPAGSTSSGYRSGNYTEIDSDYSYAQTTYSNTPKTSKSSLDDGLSIVSRTEIPRQCFKRMEYRADGKIYDARRERQQKLSTKEKLILQAHRSRNYDVWYLNSAKFMKYFCQIFTDHLAIPMGFDPEINDNTEGCVIYCDKVELLKGTLSTKLETFEIVPCVSSQWPECAQEWFDRSRRSWPHYDVIEKIKEFGCHMIPEGPVSTKTVNKYQDLEWQLIFPAAERFLETCLTHAQVRVYLISLMLHKTFIRPVDSNLGLTTSHIKNRLFWLIEEDDRPANWMENRSGKSLMKLLNSLYRSISQDEPNLPDYFVKDKNLFQGKSYLLRTQKQLKRIIENPIMYVFHAMENIRDRRTFFPRLDFEELLRILIAHTLILVNPALALLETKTVNSSNRVEKYYDQTGGLWEKDKQKTSGQPKVIHKKSAINKSLINPRKASDQVVEIPMRCAPMEPRRLSVLLNFFIKHFIKMAECCHEYRAIPQKITYVEQAERLAVLLSEHASHKATAKTHLEKLFSLRNRTTGPKTGNDPPKTPRRNPDMPVFTATLNNRFVTSEYQHDSIPASHKIYKSNDVDAKITSTVYEIEEPASVNKQVTSVLIHEEDADNSDNTKLDLPHNAIRGDAEKISDKNVTRTVSLADEPEESFLTETTYI